MADTSTTPRLDGKTTAGNGLDPQVSSTSAPRRRPTGKSRRRTKVIGTVAAVAVAGAGALTLAKGGDDNTTQTAATGTRAVEVERKDLVLSDDYDGELGFGEASSVSANKTGVVTSVPATGTVVANGQALFTIGLQPTVLLKGTVPAFRALDTSSDPGADITQLEQALADLGFGAGVTVDETYTSATATAVKRWETALGRFDPDGTVELGDVVFAPGDVRITEISASTGTQVRTDTAVVSVSPTAKVVTMTVSADAANRLEAATVVHLELPGDVETTGKITDIGPETAAANQGGPGGGGGPTVTVTITLDDPATAGDFDSGSVDVTIERSRVKDATTVPVTALLALAEGGYAVQIVDAKQPRGYRLAAVEIGTYSGNDVQVTGAGIEPGVQVLVPR